MTREKGEYNLGLCGGMSPDDFEALRDAGLITGATGVARVAMIRCVLCHFNRGKDVTGGDLTACTGVKANAYNLLTGLEADGHIREYFRDGPQWGKDTIHYTPESPEMAYLGRAFSVPERCVENQIAP